MLLSSQPLCLLLFSFFFFFNDTATTEIYTLSLHDALPIWKRDGDLRRRTELVVPGTCARIYRASTSARGGLQQLQPWWVSGLALRRTLPGLCGRSRHSVRSRGFPESGTPNARGSGRAGMAA